jgi:methyltransferase (TIGR00027 family)
MSTAFVNFHRHLRRQGECSEQNKQMGQDAGIRATSDWMASIRYRETLRPDAFLTDPCAGILSGNSTTAAEHLTQLGGPSEVVITRGWLGDKLIAQALAEGTKQIVILAAGSDARAWRLPLPADVAVYEVDLPGQHPHKTALLAAAGLHPASRLIRVPADLRDPDWPGTLEAAGFRPGRATAWLAEGLFYYTGTAFAERLIGQLHGPGSVLAFDIPHDRFLSEPANQRFLDFMAERGTPFTSATSDPAELTPGWQTSANLAAGLPVPHRLIEPQRPIWHVTARSATT